ncbi:MAG: ABC transporter ATP-binding protein [Ruminococcaceae bacterium]|nr:ABC transporter ATP-binding protein [Oscillospiraceae bacterium]
MGPGGMPPPLRHNNDSLKPQKPKRIQDVPKYLKEILFGFFKRLFYIFTLVWETKKGIFFTLIFFAILTGLFPIISAYISAQILNSLAVAYIKQTGLDTIVFWLILYFVYLFVNKIVSYLQSMVTRVSGELVTNHIKVKILNKAKEVDIGRFDVPEFYEKLENANREAGMRPIQILNSTLNTISNLITVIGFVVILCNISALVPIIIIILGLPTAIINFTFRQKNVNYMRRKSKERRQMDYYSSLLTNKDLVKEIRLFGLADLFISRYKEVFKKYFSGLKKLIVRENIWNITVSFIITLVNCLLFLYVAYKVARGELQIGDYSLYTGALNSISSGVSSIIISTATIFEGTLFIENMIVFMKDKRQIVSIANEPRIPNRAVGHTIEFRNVSFKYPGTERYVLKNINFTLNNNDTAVLVGLNGAGKTTLIKLLTRLYDPTEGEIYLDGYDLREYEVTELYNLFGIVFQDFGKYAVTVKENIAFGDAHVEIDENRVRVAAKQSNSVDYIEKLPEKFDTHLMRYFEEKGIELSIGQWQKLSIARAFYSESDILILDEPTASLDAIAEQEIFNQFDELRKDKLTLFVSHRLSSATTASKIIVLLDGEIVEEGTHNDLMASKGHYYKLFSTQAKRYTTAEA